MLALYRFRPRRMRCGRSPARTALVEDSAAIRVPLEGLEGRVMARIPASTPGAERRAAASASWLWACVRG